MEEIQRLAFALFDADSAYKTEIAKSQNFELLYDANKVEELNNKRNAAYDSLMAACSKQDRLTPKDDAKARMLAAQKAAQQMAAQQMQLRGSRR